MSFPLSEQVLQAGHLEELTTQPADTIRSRCRECEDAESAVSLARRVLQGRLDIVDAELNRRAEGRPAAPGDLSDLIDRLPSILGDRDHARGRGPGPGRRLFDLGLEIDAVGDELIAAVDAIAGVSVMTSLPTLRDGEVDDLAERLRQLEQDFSHTRRELHRRIDALRGELSNRYERGELTVDQLLG